MPRAELRVIVQGVTERRLCLRHRHGVRFWKMCCQMLFEDS